MRARVRVRQVAVMLRVKVSPQGINISQCNVLRSHEYTTVCVDLRQRSVVGYSRVLKARRRPLRQPLGKNVTRP